MAVGSGGKRNVNNLPTCCHSQTQWVANTDLVSVPVAGSPMISSIFTYLSTSPYTYAVLTPLLAYITTLIVTSNYSFYGPNIPTPVRVFSGFTSHTRATVSHHKFTYPIWMGFSRLDSGMADSQTLNEHTLDDHTLDEHTLDEHTLDGKEGGWDRLWPLAGTSRGEGNWRSWFRVRTHVDDKVWGREEGSGLYGPVVEAMESALEGEGEVEEVWVLTSWQAMGLLFNPITCFFCYDASRSLVGMVAEVTNTPWGERVLYPIPAGGSKTAPKTMHVSPFMGMDYEYRFSFSDPKQALDPAASPLIVTIALHPAHQSGNASSPPAFVATMCLRPIAVEHTFRFLLHRILSSPPPAALTWLRIHLQAAFLYLYKSIPFIAHPKYSTPTPNTGGSSNTGLHHHQS